MFPCVLAHCLLYHLLGRHKLTLSVTLSAVWVVWVDILLDPSFDRFGYFLVFLDTM